MNWILLLAALSLMRSAAQVPAEWRDAVALGVGVTAPRLQKSVAPKYSPQAQAALIQGTVLLEFAVTENGKASGIRVSSPLGFGLDEKAIEAVSAWKFTPALKDGKPVKTVARAEVNFRLLGKTFDAKTERLRTEFNVAVQGLGRPGVSNESREKAVATIRDLSKAGYAPAMYLLGIWQAKGENVELDAPGGFALIKKSAAQDYGPALYEMAVRWIEGRDLEKNVEKGLATMREASRLGSLKAQLDLGHRYESGNGVPWEIVRAREQYRLCAARGVSECQYRLGSSLLKPTDRPEHDLVEGVAWLELAASQGMADAQEFAAREVPSLTSEQKEAVAKLRGKFARQ